MSFFIRLEAVASPSTPEEAVRELVTIANRLRTGVVAQINGVEAFAFWGEDPDVVVRRWRLERDCRPGPFSKRSAAASPKPAKSRGRGR